MKTVYIDTHIVIILYSGLINKLPENIKSLIEVSDIFISPMVVLELQYLKEIGRINRTSTEIVADLQARIDLKVDDLSFEVAIQAATELSWTRDPFDRIIVACSLARGYPLITKDQKILDQHPLSMWGKN